MSEIDDAWLAIPRGSAPVFSKAALWMRTSGRLTDEEWGTVRDTCVRWAKHAYPSPPVMRDGQPIPQDLLRKLNSAPLPEKCQACGRWVVVPGDQDPTEEN